MKGGVRWSSVVRGVTSELRGCDSNIELDLQDIGWLSIC